MESCEKEREWLILAHCFNLDGRAASQTITDRLPILIRHGVVPVVISSPLGKKDCKFPHYRVLSPAPSGVLFELRHKINQKFRNKFIQQILKFFLTILLLPFYIVEKVFIHLDSHWSWVISATIFGLFIAKKHRPRLIYSTAGPSSTHLAGFFLKKILNIPWLAELHDPLLYDFEVEKGQKYKWRNWLEKIIAQHADAVVYFTDVALQRANKRHPFKGVSRVIRPGAEPPGFLGVEYSVHKKMHFGHFGSLGDDRNLGMLFQAFSEIIAQHPHLKNELCLDIFGTNLDEKSQAYMRKFPVSEILNVYGRLEYDPVSRKTGRLQVLEEMQQTDVLLLIHGHSRICQEYIPSKVYEYLLTNRPILGMVEPHSELAELLKEQGHFVVDGSDPDAIKKALQMFIQCWAEKGLPSFRQQSPYKVSNAVQALLDIEDLLLGNSTESEVRYPLNKYSLPHHGQLTFPVHKFNSEGRVVFGLRDKMFAHAKAVGNGDLPLQDVGLDWDRSPFVQMITLFTDLNIDEALQAENTYKVAWMIESPAVTRKAYRRLNKNAQYFDRILTFDKATLLKHTNAFFTPLGGCWIDPNCQSVYAKSENISIIASKKDSLPGQKLRHRIIRKFNAEIDDILGGGYRFVENKLEGLKDFRYSIVVENYCSDYYFSEKLIDCFVTGTIPIYWGCPSIDIFFDPDGLLTFETLADLRKLFTMLSEEDYQNRLEAVHRNFELARQYTVPERHVIGNLKDIWTSANV